MSANDPAGRPGGSQSQAQKEGAIVNIKPLGDRVVVKASEQEERTKSGIVLPDTAKEKPQQGKILAVGTGRILDSGERVPLEVKVGDRVIFSKYAGTEIKLQLGGEEVLILREQDVLAIVED
jgi:chaperonin GroES